MTTAGSDGGMLMLTVIVGRRDDAGMAERLHALAHDGLLERLVVSERDAHRRRLRLRTDRGTDCAIALARTETLRDGDVLLLRPDRAIVVQLGEQRWLRLVPRDAAAAVRLGYHAGNLHWRVRFDGDHILVAMDHPRTDYLARLQDFLADGLLEIGDDD